MSIRVSDVVYRKGGFQLECPDLVITKGAVTGIIGKNGSGKSTLLKLLNGGVKASHGDITVDGKALHEYEFKELSRKVSFVQQEIFDPLGFTVREVLSVSGYSRDDSETDMVDALREFEIEHLIDRKFSNLSGGERRLVTLAGSIYQNAEIMLMDEPTTFLDVDKQLLVNQVIGRLKESGRTIVVVMHDLGAVHSLADEVVLMRNGTVLHSGETDSTMNREYLNETFGVDFDIFDTSSGKEFKGRRPAIFQ